MGLDSGDSGISRTELSIKLDRMAEYSTHQQFRGGMSAYRYESLLTQRKSARRPQGQGHHDHDELIIYSLYL